MKETLHPKIQKNIYDLNHSTYLQKSHTIISLGLTLWLALIAGLITWLIEGDGEITAGLVIFFMIATSALFAFTLASYLPSKIKRNYILRDIEKLNSKADKL